MFKKITNFFVALVQKYLPDAFLFAVFLTFLTLILGVFVTNQSLVAMITHWGDGFWALLSFSMQMALVLVTGHTLASSRPFKKFLSKLAEFASTPTEAILAVSFVSAIACWINWGFGLVIGALYARELAKRVKDVDYRLLIASAYSGFLVWHGGISASIPLTLATDGAANAAATAGAITEIIPTTATIFSPLNLIVSAIFLFTLPFINRAMHPAKDLTITVDPALLVDPEEPADFYKNDTPADKIENSKLINYLIFLVGITYVVLHFMRNGFDLNLNIVNFIFLIFGVLFHQTPRRFIHSFGEAATSAGPILLQFPFYAGIMGMMVGQSPEGISLAGSISNWFVSISNERTYPVFAFLSAGIVNFFVPSGGGQWAVQAPIMMPAAKELGVSAAKTAVAISWGDAWTNMIQPFWALPALGIAGLGARDIMGFCVMILAYSGVVISLALYFL